MVSSSDCSTLFRSIFFRPRYEPFYQLSFRSDSKFRSHTPLEIRSGSPPPRIFYYPRTLILPQVERSRRDFPLSGASHASKSLNLLALALATLVVFSHANIMQQTKDDDATCRLSTNQVCTRWLCIQFLLCCQDHEYKEQPKHCLRLI